MKLPLELPSSASAIIPRMSLIKQAGFLSFEELAVTLKGRTTRSVPDADKKRWALRIKNIEFTITDFDLAEPFTAFVLSRTEKLTEHQLSSLIPTVEYYRNLFGEEFPNAIRDAAKASASNIQKEVMP